jgi:hypothetical protein
MYKELKKVLETQIEHCRKLPESDDFTSRDKYYITEGLTLAINSITNEENFVKDRIALETLENTMKFLKGFISEGEVRMLVEQVYKGEDKNEEDSDR